MTTQIEENKAVKKITMDTLTVEKYEKLKAGKATDGAIVSMLGTYPAKLIAWKRENGLMEDKPAEAQPAIESPEVKTDAWAEVKKQVENVSKTAQDVVQQAEEPKETNSSSVDYKAEYEELMRELSSFKLSHDMLLGERNELFDKAEDFKRNHDEVWKRLQSEMAERATLQNKLFEAEKNSEQFEEKEFALQEALKKTEVERDRVRSWAERLEQQNVDLVKKSNENNDSVEIGGVTEVLKESEQLNLLLMKRVIRMANERGADE